MQSRRRRIFAGRIHFAREFEKAVGIGFSAADVRGGREAPAPSQGYGAAAPVNTEPQILPSRYLLSRPADSLLIRSPALWTIWSRDWYAPG